jgi:hypothetical protein
MNSFGSGGICNHRLRARSLHPRTLTQAADSLDLFFDTDTGDQSPTGAPLRVTDANKLAYVQSRTHHVLVGSRAAQLLALKEGFLSLDLASNLQARSGTGREREREREKREGEKRERGREREAVEAGRGDRSSRRRSPPLKPWSP